MKNKEVILANKIYLILYIMMVLKENKKKIVCLIINRLKKNNHQININNKKFQKIFWIDFNYLLKNCKKENKFQNKKTNNNTVLCQKL